MRHALIELAWPRIEQLAPGFSQRIVADRILTALDGAPRREFDRRVDQWGPAALDQQLIFRSIPGVETFEGTSTGPDTIA